MRLGCNWMTHWRIPLTGAEGESGRKVRETLRPKDSDICSRSIKGLFIFVCTNLLCKLQPREFFSGLFCALRGSEMNASHTATTQQSRRRL